MESKVSVVVPAYHSKEFLEKALRSVEKQSFKDFEVVVVEDERSHGCKEIVERFGDRYRYYRKGRNVSESRNYGIEKSQGEYIAFLDSDDTWFSENLKRKLEFLDDNPDCSLVFSRFVTVFPDGGTEDAKSFDGDIIGYFLKGRRIQTSAVMARKEDILEAGMFDEEMPYWEDSDLWMKLSEEGRIGFIDDVLTVYNKREDSRTNTGREGIMRYFMRFCDRHWDRLSDRARSDLREFIERYTEMYV